MEPKICIQLSPPLKPQQSNDNDEEQKRDISCKETVKLKFAKFAPEAWTDLVGIYIHTYSSQVHIVEFGLRFPL